MNWRKGRRRDNWDTFYYGRKNYIRFDVFRTCRGWIVHAKSLDIKGHLFDSSKADIVFPSICKATDFCEEYAKVNGRNSLVIKEIK